MTPEDIARLHAAAFAPERGWTDTEIADLLRSPHVALFYRAGGFALVRTVAREAELLTLAVHPDMRRQGIANALMTDWMRGANADIAFLEVASDNLGALALYHTHGFAKIGLRVGYYRRPFGPAVDAVLMKIDLTSG